MNVQTLQEKKAALSAAIARHVYEPPEAAELRQTETALREAERAEEDARARERARRAALLAPELERATAATLKAVHGFAAAFEAERAVRERADAAGLGELAPWSVAPMLAAALLRIAAEKENRQ